MNRLLLTLTLFICCSLFGGILNAQDNPEPSEAPSDSAEQPAEHAPEPVPEVDEQAPIQEAVAIEKVKPIVESEQQANEKNVIENVVVESKGEEGAASLSCSDKCQKHCKCWNSIGGGGPIVVLLFNRYTSKAWGDYDGPTVWYGGRGYGYVMDNKVRLGGMGVGGVGPEDDDIYATKNSDSLFYPTSTGRVIYGGYGGFTAEYVFRASKHVEFPVGGLIGFGGGGYESRLSGTKDLARGVESSYNKGGFFIALQPMVGVEASPVQWFKIQIAASYLFAKPFNGTKHLGGFAMIFGLNFGKFWPDKWAMED